MRKITCRNFATVEKLESMFALGPVFFLLFPGAVCLILLLTPLVLFVLQCQKLREVFNLDYPHSTFLLKTLTIVSGPDMVDLTFHNFVSYKENVGKVCGPEGREAL